MFKMSKIVPFKEVLKQCLDRHHGKYTYIEDSYRGVKYKMKIICPEHGCFEQCVYKHVQGQGCPKCALKQEKNYSKKSRRGQHKISFQEFKQKAILKHGGRFEYDASSFKNMNTHMKIYCPEHGWFEQTPNQHLRTKNGCSKCANKNSSQKQRYTFAEFVDKANKIHKNEYSYSKTYGYRVWNEKIPIKCPKHGVFWQTPNEHLQGYGCAFCKESSLERRIRLLLEEKCIAFEYEKKFEWLRNKGNMSLDFYLPEYNIAIECQGEQHYRPVRFGGCDLDVANKKFKYVSELDKLKKKLCQEHGLPLYYIAYNDKLEERVKEIFNTNIIDIN